MTARQAPSSRISSGIDVEVAKAGTPTQITLLDRQLTLPLTSHSAGAAKMVLRPHHIQLSRDAVPHHLPAEVTYAAWLGNSVQYTLSTPVGSIFAIGAPQPLPFRQGETVHLGFGLDDVRLVPA
jgi:iron(III) transport system ATP-binding protein